MRNLLKRYRTLVALCLFFVGACWVTWPTVYYLRSAIPSGDSPTATVPFLNAWTIWWNSEQLQTGFAQYWNAPIFFPAQGAFAFSEPQPVSITLAPVVWYASLPTAYNCYLLLGLTLNGYCAYRLLAYLKCQAAFALAGGLGIVCLPISLHNLEAIQLTHLWAILWSIELCARLIQQRTWRLAIQLALAIVLLVGTCLYHASFFLLLLPAFVLAVMGRPTRQNLRDYATIVTAVAASLILCAPYLGNIYKIHQQVELVRPQHQVETLSAHAGDWLAIAGQSWLPKIASSDVTPLNPGWLRWVAAASVLFIPRLRRRRTVVGLIVLCVLSMLLAFGPNLNMNGWSLWTVTSDFVPPLRSIRSPYRFAYITQLTILLCAALACDHAYRRLRMAIRTRSRSAQLALNAATMGLLAVVAIEVIPGRTHIAWPPAAATGQPDWVAFLQENTPPNAALLCLPQAPDLSELGLEREARWMWLATLHERPIANGYSGYFPQAWHLTRDAILDAGLTASHVRSLIDAGIHYIVLHNSSTQTGKSKLRINALPENASLIFEGSVYSIIHLTP